MAGDPRYSSVSLLLHGDSGNDASLYAQNQPLPSGAVSSAESKFGGTSFYFGAAPRWFEFTTPVTIGSYDFTVEMWINVSSFPTTQNLISNYYAGGGISLYLNTSGNLAFDSAGGSCVGSIPITVDTWIHVAASRSGSTLRLFVDGAIAGSNSSFGASTGSSQSLRFGMPIGGGPYLQGYIDEVRITSVARYTDTFSPPTAAFDNFQEIIPISGPMGNVAAFGGGVFSKAQTEAYGLNAFGGGNAVLAAPSRIFYAGASGSGTFSAFAGSPILLSSGRDTTGENSAYITASRQTLYAYAGANANIAAPTQTLSVTGTFTVAGGAVLSAPTPTLTTTGTTTALATAALTAPMAKLVGYFGAVATVSVTGSPTLTATGTTGAVGRATLTAPLFDLTATATRQNSGSAILTAPIGRLATTGAAWLVAPGAQLTAIGTATVAVAYEAYAVNLNHRDPASNNQVTRYTNYPFDRIVRYKSSYFGMNSTGLYLLEGTTDNATPIAYEVKTHVTDFDATEQKTVVSAYIGGRMGVAETVTLFSGEKTANAYHYTTPRGVTPQNYRQKFGRGIKARYYGIGFKGDKEFDLDALELEINKLPRRI